MRAWGFLAAIGVAALSGGCTSVYNLPHNQPLTGSVEAAPLGGEVPLSSDDVMIGLAFSGGGTRAAAFSFGVLKEIEATRIRDRGKNVSLLDRCATRRNRSTRAYRLPISAAPSAAG
jgi:NTE family protein